MLNVCSLFLNEVEETRQRRVKLYVQVEKQSVLLWKEHNSHYPDFKVTLHNVADWIKDLITSLILQNTQKVITYESNGQFR